MHLGFFNAYTAPSAVILLAMHDYVIRNVEHVRRMIE